MNNCGIYQIRNTINNDLYIGQSSNISKRKRYHYGLLKWNKHDNPHLQNAYNKYGGDNFKFEVLLYCEPFELTRYEQGLVDRLNPSYNIRKLCIESNKGIQYGEEVIRKLSECHRGNTALLGHVHTEETKLKMSISRTGKKQSEETRMKHSIAMKLYCSNRKKNNNPAKVPEQQK